MMTFAKEWASIQADLRRAMGLLPDDVSKDLVRLSQEFIENNELELACDSLEDAAEGHPVSKSFWHHLRDAAAKMKLEDRATRYKEYADKSLS